MRGKYKRRKRARIVREGGELALLDRPLDVGYHDQVLDAATEANPFREHWALIDAIEQACKMKRSKRKGTANLDENMKTLGFRRVFGDKMVPEQFEAVR